MKTHKNANQRQSPELGFSRWLIEEQWYEILKEFDNQCAYCGVKAPILTRDHIVPVGRGGTNTKHNIVPTCDRCNKSKAMNGINWWYNHQPFFSVERLDKILAWRNSFK